MVSLKMLRSLIEKSVVVDGFVPHSVEICATLLAYSESTYQIGAADVLCILCYKLSLSPASESSRRLILDAKGRLIPPLQKMASEAIASVNDTIANHTRFAAILAIGHIANCLGGTLSNDTRDMIAPLLMNLLMLIRERAKQPLREETEIVLGEAEVEEVITSAILPAQDPLLVYKKASCFAIGAVAGCVTSAEVDVFLSKVIGFLDKKKGWSTYTVPMLIFRALTVAMENRPQLLGFSVYQCLCSIGRTNKDPTVRIGVLRSLRECVLVVPMTGGRPRDLQEYILAVMELPVTTGERYDNATSEALVDLTSALMLSTYKRRNTSQLQFILSALLDALRKLEKVDESCTLMALRCMAVASPYVRTAPLSDRSSLNVTGLLGKYLDSTSSDQQRTMGIRILRGILAGVPDDGSGEARTGLLATDENDIFFAQEWLWRIIADKSSITPRCVVQVAHTLVALCNGYGTAVFPFLLTWLHHVQATFGAAPHTSELGRAWLHMVCVCVIGAGSALELPKLAAYGEDILTRRLAAEEGSPFFKSTLDTEHRLSECFTHSGLVAHSKTKKSILSAEENQPPVTKLVSFDFITSILVDSERNDIAHIFGTTLPELKVAVDQQCLQPNSVDRCREISQQASVAEVEPMPQPFSLPLDIVDLKEVEVTVVDGQQAKETTFTVTGTSLDEKIDSILKHFNVAADTPLARPAIAAAPLPLFAKDDTQLDVSVKSAHSAGSTEQEGKSEEEEEKEKPFTETETKKGVLLSTGEVEHLPFHSLWTPTLPSSQYVNMN
ncbi:hypothetical protein AGDE_01673 [Angomonas deanei]|uniref:Uncharacterized protein n=1 Tax=Angomonas deanei TaxID=59799 RepID=S9X1L1_9TRYP|nr:hypothetical protein AGDE_07988 [Angomonas deanei]EPY42250.1 hypothetical protein AGDE_01673 [Angomonas deanei]CAD2215148.1 hypothetical protein, conserved [Angomonas deanei]|eukprot:EPY34104.1 hypothetical protein AGDE_07988 [Angomonas deanei]